MALMQQAMATTTAMTALGPAVEAAQVSNSCKPPLPL
jgi:hypothetical protein